MPNILAFAAFLSSSLAIGGALIFLILNIFNESEGGAGYLWLLICFVAGLVTFFLKLVNSDGVGIRRSFFWLCLFLTYFMFRVVLDYEDYGAVQSFFLGTTGGVIFGYLFGTLLRFSIEVFSEKATRSKFARKIILLSLSLLLATCLIVFLFGVVSMSSKLRLDILLLEENEGYQRRGVFLSIVYLVVSFIAVLHTRIVATYFQNRRSVGLRWVTLFTAATYILMCPIFMYLSQLMGSNSGVLFVGLVTIVSVALGLWRGAENLGISKKIGRALLISALLGGVVLLLSYQLNIDFSGLRITNFGETAGAPTSVMSRLNIIENNYLDQLSVSPILGNMKADQLVSGVGTYAHSFVLSMLSHLGLIGFVLFFIFFVVAIRELKRDEIRAKLARDSLSRAMSSYGTTLVWVVIAIATISTFINWVPFWFSLGFLVPSLRLREKNALTRRVELPLSN